MTDWTIGRIYLPKGAGHIDKPIKELVAVRRGDEMTIDGLPYIVVEAGESNSEAGYTVHLV